LGIYDLASGWVIQTTTRNRIISRPITTSLSISALRHVLVERGEQAAKDHHHRQDLDNRFHIALL
jgi:hypothetical protein